MKVVAVTGASGFIGSHIVKQLLERGYTVHATVRNKDDPVKTEHLRKMEGLGGALKLYSADLDVAGSFDEAFRGSHVVVHTAAEVDISNKDPQKVVNASTKGSFNVLDSIAKSGTVKRLVHTSSIAAIVRTDYPEGYHYSEADYNTHSTIENGEAYAYAKYLAEHMVVERCNTMKLDVVVINPGYVLGECLSKAHTKASPYFVRNLLFGGTLPNLWCSFVDVADVAKAHVQAVDATGVVGRRFILSGDSDTCAVSMDELGACCQRVRPDIAWPTTQFIDMGELSKKCTFDNSASKQVLGISYADFPSMVTRTISSMLDTNFVKLRVQAKL
ncbi:hypothetical protein CYMTET_14693 [Cymbomonas tetramitiformis]|uniref:Flavanone 4-reductase n=1 Tax=Cymbomonas tetramitiformis TaxID=36881 RepID=A0AAE0GFT4_9CHLO|nr:hypothetical protein CYMTET_14693 [Cymbomonas tetramitiformis]